MTLWAGTCSLTLILGCLMLLMHLPTAHALQHVFNFQGKLLRSLIPLIRQCTVCGLCCSMAYLFATRGLTIACNDRWWTAYLPIVPSVRLSCHRQTMKPILEELNRQKYKEEVDSAMILQTSTSSAAGELMATVVCKCSREQYHVLSFKNLHVCTLNPNPTHGIDKACAILVTHPSSWLHRANVSLKWHAKKCR